MRLSGRIMRSLGSRKHEGRSLISESQGSDSTCFLCDDTTLVRMNTSASLLAVLQAKQKKLVPSKCHGIPPNVFWQSIVELADHLAIVTASQVHVVLSVN